VGCVKQKMALLTFFLVPGSPKADDGAAPRSPATRVFPSTLSGGQGTEVFLTDGPPPAKEAGGTP